MADFQKNVDAFTQRRAPVVALSVDPREEAEKTVSRHGLTFPVAYGVDARSFAAATGAFYDETKGFLQATGFLLKKDGTLAGAVYSTGPIGRYTASDILAAIDHYQET